MSGRKKRQAAQLNGPFVMHSLAMRSSRAWAALSDNGRRLLDRIEREHMEHGGADNGELVVTYNDFVTAGLRRQTVSKAIHQAEALGFIKVERRGYMRGQPSMLPNRFLLTYVQGRDRVSVGGRKEAPIATNDWMKLDCDEAVAIALAAVPKPVARRAACAYAVDIDGSADSAPFATVPLPHPSSELQQCRYRTFNGVDIAPDAFAKATERSVIAAAVEASTGPTGAGKQRHD